MKTADDHEPDLASAAVELGAESGVATILTGKSQSGSRNDEKQIVKLSAEMPCSVAQVRTGSKMHRSSGIFRRSPIASHRNVMFKLSNDNRA
jgi:hypothetical protein